MLNLNELEQLVTFADTGTLSVAAEKLHISQPTITRSMQHLEDEFGVSLFTRGKNKISLNPVGIKAVEEARHLLLTAENMIKSVRDYDKSLHTISVTSCAPAPLWYVLPALSSAYPDMTISSSLKGSSETMEDILSGSTHLAILTEEIKDNNYLNIAFLKENLSVCVPAGHDLAKKSSVTFSELNGFNFLLRSELGFWDEMCRINMPSSRFLVQTNEFEFIELIKESSLPCFTTNLAKAYDNVLKDRINIPVTNPEANVTYFLVCHSDDKAYTEVINQIKINL